VGFISTLAAARPVLHHYMVQNREIPKEFVARFPDFLPHGGKMAASADKGKLAGASHCQMRHPVFEQIRHRGSAQLIKSTHILPDAVQNKVMNVYQLHILSENIRHLNGNYAVKHLPFLSACAIMKTMR